MKTSVYGEVSKQHLCIDIIPLISLFCKDLSYFDVVSVAAFYQLTLYMAIRLAHHSFTLGELGLTSFGGTILFMETIHVTMARVRVVSY